MLPLKRFTHARVPIGLLLHLGIAMCLQLPRISSSMVSFLGPPQRHPRGRLSTCRLFHRKATAQPHSPELPGQAPALQLLKQTFPQNLHITHTEDYSWSQKHRKIEAANMLDFSADQGIYLSKQQQNTNTYFPAVIPSRP